MRKLHLFCLVTTVLLASLVSRSESQWVRTNGPGAITDYTPILCLEPYGNRLFAGTEGQYIAQTSNGGETWSNVGHTGLTEATIYSIAAHETMLIAGTLYGRGVYMSTDDGENWFPPADSVLWWKRVNKVVCKDSYIFAASSGGIARSSDDGETWTMLKNGIPLNQYGDPDVNFWSILVSGDHIYAGGMTNSTLSCKVFLSKNDGARWNDVSFSATNTYVSAFASIGANLFAGTSSGKVYLSADEGASWENVSNGLPEDEYNTVWAMAVSGKNIFISTTYWGVFHSSDNGSNWTSTANGGGGSNWYTYGLAVMDTFLCVGSASGWVSRLAMHEEVDTLRDVGVWQEIRLKAEIERFSPSPDSNVVTFDGHEARIVSASYDSLIVRVPEALVGNRSVPFWPDTTAREIDIIATVVHAPGDSTEICRERARFLPPQPLLYDQVTRANPPIFQDVVAVPGPAWRRAFLFIGQATDGTAAVRLLNTSLATPPLTLLGKIIAPDGELFENNEDMTPGNLVNIGNNNAGIQFPVSQDGLYVIVVEAADTAHSSPAPWSFGPFPASYQIHLAGNTGLPRKLINDVPEPARSIRLDTYVNHPAPRDETLLEFQTGDGSFAETGLFKFANPLSVSRSPIAVLIPPLAAGFAFGVPPVRAAAPTVPGLLPGGFDPSVPMAQTPGAADPVPGTVVDFAQVPIPASVISPGPPPGVAAILGSPDGNSVSLPYAGGITSLICDMGSGNEIVDGTGMDLRVVGTGGTYSMAVSNTPFVGTFVPLGSDSGETEFDLAPAGLSPIRYILVSGTTSIDAIVSINFFADRVDPQIGALSDVGAVTITMRRLKSPPGELDPYLELIGPDGSALGKNDSGFGDDTDMDHSDAALISVPLTGQGFHRFLGRGYDTQPDERSHGTFLARLETAGAFDQTEIAISSASEDLTQAQRVGIMNQGPRQRDSYLFQAQPGQAVNMVVNGVPSGQTPALSDPLVELYDPEDMLIAANDNYTGRGKNAAMHVDLPDRGQGGSVLPNPSTYRIVVCGIDQLGTATGTTGGNAYARLAASGAYEVKVFTGEMSGEVPLAPAVSAVAPDKAVAGVTGVPLQISGAHFSAGAAVSFSGAGIAVRSVTMVNPGEIAAVIDIAADVAIGTKSITVTNWDGLAGTGHDLFEIRASLGTSLLSWDAPPTGNAPPLNLALGFGPLYGSLPDEPGIGDIGQQRSWHGTPAWTAESPDSLIVDEIEPNDSPEQAQVLSGDTIIVVQGEIGEGADMSDLFKATTGGPGLHLRLTGFTWDCDLVVFNFEDMSYVVSSESWGDAVPEEVTEPDLPAGIYLVCIFYVSSDPAASRTSYDLTVRGQLGSMPADSLQSYRVYRSTVPDARATGTLIASVPSTRTDHTDPIPYAGHFYYQVTAMYDAGESAPSNEVSTRGSRGDVNGDHAVNVLDMLTIANHILYIVPLNEHQIALADCNGDGSINVLDMVGIAMVILGIGECQP